MEIRLTPDQMKGVNLVQDIARAAGMNLYLTGGAIRDIISGFTIRDLDFTVQGNPLKLQKDLETGGRANCRPRRRRAHACFCCCRAMCAPKSAWRAPSVTRRRARRRWLRRRAFTTILRRRDFTVNAMALSLNEGSRGLLLDPFNGVADIEAKLIRILQTTRSWRIRRG